LYYHTAFSAELPQLPPPQLPPPQPLASIALLTTKHHDGITVSLSEVSIIQADQFITYAIELFLAIIFTATPSALLFKQYISLLYI